MERFRATRVTQSVFIFRGKERASRSLAKAVSWRVLGSIDTFVLSYIFTGDVKAAGAIASTEVLTKIVLYYFHERAWAVIPWGHRAPVDGEEEPRDLADPPSPTPPERDPVAR